MVVPEDRNLHRLQSYCLLISEPFFLGWPAKWAFDQMGLYGWFEGGGEKKQRHFFRWEKRPQKNMSINEIFHDTSNSSSLIWKSSLIMHLAFPLRIPRGRGESEIYLSYGTSTAIFFSLFPKLMIISSPAWTLCSIWENLLFSSPTFKVSINFPPNNWLIKLNQSHIKLGLLTCQVVKEKYQASIIPE